VTTSAAAGYSNAIGVDIPLVGIRANESNGSMHKTHDVAHLVAWLRTMYNGEYRVSAI